MTRALSNFAMAPVLVLIAACSSTSTPAAVNPKGDGGTPPETCPAGSMPVVGAADCQPVGWTNCPSGFVPDPSGWGCIDVLPAAACTGATRESIGETACRPIGDCTTPFPPPGATVFVDPTFAVLDATHYATITSAVAAAPAGSVVAVASGTYKESVVIPRAMKIAGRCAAKVIVDGGGTTTSPGIGVTAPGVEVSGLTLTGHLFGASAGLGSDVVLRDCVLDGNMAMGMFVSMGAVVAVSNCAIRGTLVDSTGAFGRGINVQTGAALTLSDSTVAGNRNSGVYVSGSGTRATLKGVVIRDTTPNDATDTGRGLVVQLGASLDVSSSVLIANYETGMLVAAATAKADHVVIRDTRVDKGKTLGRGINVQDGGTLTMTESALVRNQGAALMVVTNGTSASFDRSCARDTKLTSVGDYGRGLVVQEGAHLSATGTAVVTNREVAVGIFGQGTSAELTSSAIVGTELDAVGGFGYGLAVLDRSKVRVDRCFVNGSKGVGVAFATSSSVVSSSIVSGNAIGLYVEDGTTLDEVMTAPDVVGASEVAITSDTLFPGNQTRVSAGVLPLPKPVLTGK